MPVCALVYLGERKKKAREKKKKESHSVAMRCARMAAPFRAIPRYKGFGFKSARLYGSKGIAVAAGRQWKRERGSKRETGFVGRNERGLARSRDSEAEGCAGAGRVLGFWVRSATKFGKAALYDECGTVGQRTP